MLVSTGSSSDPFETSPLENPGRQRRQSRIQLAAHSTPEDLFAVETVPVGNGNWSAVRYNVSTGSSWALSGELWKPIREIQQLKPTQPSKFIVKMRSTKVGRFAALRLDVRSGQTWQLNNGLWKPILIEAKE